MTDPVNNPAHYCGHASGVECIKDYAIQMQRALSKQGPSKEGDPAGYIRTARWHYWHSKYSASPTECLMAAKSQFQLARDIQKHPEDYTRKPAEISCWQWFQRREKA